MTVDEKASVLKMEIKLKTWQEYKTTFPKTPSVFELARSGDLSGLRDILIENPEFDFNQKNPSGYTPLMLAVYNGRRDFCEALLRLGVCVESADSILNSALMAASFKGNLEIIKLLLEYGANPQQQNASSMNAYDWAKMFGRVEVTSFYNENGFYREKEYSKIKSLWRFIMLIPIMLKNRTQKTAQP